MFSESIAVNEMMLEICCCAVFFWAPTFKWGISFANIADLQRPPEKVSLPQQGGELCWPFVLFRLYESMLSWLDLFNSIRLNSAGAEGNLFMYCMSGDHCIHSLPA